jgi:hypothetical protein
MSPLNDLLIRRKIPISRRGKQGTHVDNFFAHNGNPEITTCTDTAIDFQDGLLEGGGPR